MKGQFSFLFEINVELELTEVNFDGLSGFFFHLLAPNGFLNKGEILKGYAELQKVRRFKPSLLYTKYKIK